MLSNYISQRLGGGGGVFAVSGEALYRHSANFAAAASARRDAIDMALSGRTPVYSGARLDSARVAGNEAQKRSVLALQALAAEHARSDGAFGQTVRGWAEGRMDAAIPMASQGLASIYKQVYEIEHAGLSAWDKMILPVDTTVDPAAEQYVWYEKDIAGAPRAASTYDVSTIPMVVGPTAGQNVGNIVPALVGWESNFMDVRREALQRRNGKPDFQVEAGKIDTCKRVLAEFFNSLWLYGDTALGIDGLHSSPLVQAAPASAGPWAALTVTQIIAELTKIFYFIPDAAQGGLLGDMRKVYVMLPPSQYNIATTPTPSVGGVVGPSPWQSFRDAHGLKDDQLVKIYEFASANSAVFTGGPLGLAADRAYIVYKAGDIHDPHFILSQPIEVPAAPRMTGVGEAMYMHARGGGIKIADARRIAYYSGL